MSIYFAELTPQTHKRKTCGLKFIIKTESRTDIFKSRLVRAMSIRDNLSEII